MQNQDPLSIQLAWVVDVAWVVDENDTATKASGQAAFSHDPPHYSTLTSTYHLSIFLDISRLHC